MSYTFNWLAIPNVVSLGLSAFLVYYVLKTNPNRDYNRVFALMFTDVGITAFSGTMILLSTDSNVFVWKDLLFLSSLPIYGLVAYFVSIFPRKCTVFGKHRYVAALLFLPSVLAGGLYLRDRSPFIAGGHLEGSWEIVTITSLFYALLVLVRSHLYAISEIERRQVKYVLVAFALQAIFCVTHLAFRILPSFYIVHAVAAASVLVDVLFVVLIAYAILKYQLFDIEVKMKRGIRYSIVTITLGFSVVIFNESMEFFLVKSLGIRSVFLVIAAAVLLATLFIPVNSLAKGGVNRLFPNVSDSGRHYNLKKMEIYRAALEQAWVDGSPSEKEKAMLKRLREKLDLSEKDHKKLEAETKMKLRAR